MSAEAEETKTQEQATQAAKPKPKPLDTSKQELIIDQVRNELETYFAPQNIQNDFNLRQKMTTDGYIDINVLLDLKLLSDLASSRDTLIEAISRSKLLVMNTGCTMVKYMPLLERNVLILRDIPTSTKKEDILAIFNNDNCDFPAQVHSDIGNNWFCQFETEEQCLKSAKYLQQFGTFNNEKLHVRVKAIHDNTKADTSPQMQPSSPVAKPPKQTIDPYPQAYYGSPQYAYYGQQPMDAYYGYTEPPNPGKDVGVDPVVVDVGARVKEEERTAISDYPGVFDKYSVTEFLDIYKGMSSEALDIPQSMRGRDQRIVNESAKMPAFLSPKSTDKRKSKGKGKRGDKGSDDSKEMEDNMGRNKGRNNRRGRGRGRGRGKGQRNRGQRDRKRVMQGTFYEDEFEDVNADMYGYYDDGYDKAEMYADEDGYYGQYYNEDNKRYYNEENRQYQSQSQSRQKGRGNRQYGQGRQYQSKRRGYNSYGGGGQQQQQRGYYGGYGQRYKPRGKYVAKNKEKKAENIQNSNNDKPMRSASGKQWSQKQAKRYTTNKGVYRTKQ